mgnify:CR=1 FL=1
MNLWHSLWHRRRHSQLNIRSFVPSFSSLSSRKSRRFKFSWLRLIQWLAISGFLLTVLGVIGFFGAFAWVVKDLPSPDSIVRNSGYSTKIVDRNGAQLYDVFTDERRTPVTIEQVPEYLKQATISIEDKDFYKHAGFDPLTPFRIGLNVITRQRVIGGSTLTQQLVKTRILTSERTLMRKFKELVLSLEIERRFSKDQILQMYLNEAPYGGTASGVGAASEVYFSKPVKDLTLVESAILAGLPQRPTAYSPFGGQKDADGTPLWQVRVKGVLRRMQEDGYISKDLHDQAVTQLPTIQFAKQFSRIQAPHFVFYIKNKLEDMYGADLVEKGGLRVTTTLDLPFQQKAQDIVAQEIEKVKNFHITNGAAIVMDPKTGEILAMVGSKDYFAKDYDGQFNVVVDGLRQPGSSIKPVTYLMALRKGYTPGSMVVDAPTAFPGGAGLPDYEPKNYDGKFHGPMSLRTALASSINIPAVKLLALVGVPNMLQQAYDMGFATLAPSAENQRRFGLSVTLGGGEIHLIDTVTAYSAFANSGYRIDPVGILKVEDRNGKVLFDQKNIQGKPVMTAEENFLINHMLSDNNARLLTFGANSLLNFNGKAVAVKTGTTNNRKDNWTIGWSQSTIVGVWVGNNDNSEMTNVASGVTGASPIWRKIFDEAVKEGRLIPDWVVPSGVQTVRADAISGYPAHDNFPESAEYVIPSTFPSLPDPIHSKIKVCKSEGKLATEVDIQRGSYDEREFITLKEFDPISTDGKNRWQDGIDQWISSLPADQQSRYRPPTELCGGSKDEVWINMSSPQDRTDYPGTSIDVNVTTATEGEMDRVEIWINGVLRETLRASPYTTTLSLQANRYTIFARGIRKDGKQGQTGDVHIGTGGTHWEAPPPSPTPLPTPSPSPTPGPTPSPSPGP